MLNGGISAGYLYFSLKSEEIGINRLPQNKKSYSVAEIQQILGISRPTAYALIKKDLFQSVRMGNGIRIIKSSFDAWLDNTM